ncbi:unnamed protein product [Ceutorhynchus assimilis]|uniref:Uncharacterized protein n=1 Tax=Ceutorhynchus assimilis TaxID=467358 RepID=A0A9N9MVT3_9CUCU|nr:unnamed protein product [Ceutorhynchus assimilis]
MQSKSIIWIKKIADNPEKFASRTLKNSSSQTHKTYPALDKQSCSEIKVILISMKHTLDDILMSLQNEKKSFHNKLQEDNENDHEISRITCGQPDYWTKNFIQKFNSNLVICPNWVQPMRQISSSDIHFPIVTCKPFAFTHPEGQGLNYNDNDNQTKEFNNTEEEVQ